MAETRILELTAEEFAAITPPDAAAVIMAGYDVDRSEIRTDYFYVGGVFDVVLGFSKHTRDMFAEMRKAAGRFAPTEHLGPGRSVCRVRAVLACNVQPYNGCALWAGQYSPFHRNHEPSGDGHAHPFTTRAEAAEFIAKASPLPVIKVAGQDVSAELQIIEEDVEQREKYSMGRGYYLKASTYGNGWRVYKTPLPLHQSRFIVAGYLAPDGVGHPVPGPIEAVPDEPRGMLAEVAASLEV